MTGPASRSGSGWKQSRFGFVAFWLAWLMAGWFALRLVLFFVFRPAAPVLDGVAALLTGSTRDFAAACWLTLPLLCWMLVTPDRRFAAQWHRRLFWGACFLFWSVGVFLLFVEYFFFDEFRSRFNTVAVDYLEYPQEVFINIWDSYHVGLVMTACLLLGLGWVWMASRLFRGMWERPVHTRPAVVWPLACMGLVAFLSPFFAIAGALTGVWFAPVAIKGAEVSSNRTLNEIADNGALAFFAAALTHHLDYSAFYKTLPRDEAYQRVRRVLAEPGATFAPEAQSILRRFAGDPARPRLNVVIFLEESFGSEFWGCLGRRRTLTPEMDKLAATEGLLFTNIYACGNRTVRGMEGVLSSFPPLPGDSIVKRDRSDNVETLARLLKRDGYSTLFLYGGRGMFDGMRSFALRNGYDRFIEQRHFAHPTFTTIWGVCDEDLYMRSIEEFSALANTNTPFFATVLSVSNHKPYTYPAGTIPEDPNRRRRENAVKYSDYALGRFFKEAKKQPFWTNTIFVVVADHGARVYGNQTIPIHSYEIPLLIVGPAVVNGPERIGTLGCSLDVSPTLLGLIGRPYESLFFGRDLLKCPPGKGRALLSHNRDIGLLARDRMVVLGLMQTEQFYSGDPKRVEMSILAQPVEADLELGKDAMAVYQVADELYTHQLYRLDGAADGSAGKPASLTMANVFSTALGTNELASTNSGSFFPSALRSEQ